MDKLKIFLAVAKKHQFWVCCGVILLTSLGCWWWATGTLAKAFERRKSAIKSDFDGASVPDNSPNEKVAAKIKEDDEALKKKVYDAWETLYTQQKEKNPFPTKELGKDFEKEFESLQLPKDELAPRYLERYQNHIKKYLPTLEKIVKVRHEVVKKDAALGAASPSRTESGGGFGDPRRGIRGPGMPMPPMRQPGRALDPDKEYTGVVDWDEGNYATVAGRFDWGDNRTPTTLEVVLAQEDLWVYEALLRAIKKVNAGATTQANAPIKRIDAIEIGKDATKAWEDARKSVFAPGKSGPGTPGPLPEARGVPGGEGQNRPSGQQQTEQNLFKDRYVDESGQPLPFEAEYPHARHPIPEFKMMPIRMRLEMDQRRLPMLLVECANSNMPIEVRRLRILKDSITALDPGSSTSGGTGREMSGGGGFGRPGMPMVRRPETAASPRASSGTQDTAGQVDVPVEVYAIIYIYNPPDRAKLGIPEKKPAEAAGAVDPAGGQPGNAAAAQPSPAATPRK